MSTELDQNQRPGLGRSVRKLDQRALRDRLQVSKPRHRKLAYLAAVALGLVVAITLFVSRSTQAPAADLLVPQIIGLSFALQTVDKAAGMALLSPSEGCYISTGHHATFKVRETPIASSAARRTTSSGSFWASRTSSPLKCRAACTSRETNC